MKYKGSFQQTRLRKILEEIFDTQAEEEKKYAWLKSPKGRNLRVDIVFEKYKIAIEYHGKQHYFYPNKFHKSKVEFVYLRLCDKIKKNKLKEMGYVFLEVPYSVRLTKPAVKYFLKTASI